MPVVTETTTTSSSDGRTVRTTTRTRTTTADEGVPPEGGGGDPKHEAVPRLLLCASNVPGKDALMGALLPGVHGVEYDFGSESLASVYMALRGETRQQELFGSIAICAHGAPGRVDITESVSITTANVASDDVTLFIGCLGECKVNWLA
eukprot:COSAG04_NODE_617_length_11897_cov_27.308696_8_plen_149_part_00